MAFLNRASDRLQTALQGGPAGDSLRPDVEVVRSLGEVRFGQNAYGPDPAFVASLAERLLAQQPVPQTRPVFVTAGRHRYPVGLAPSRGPVVSIVQNTVPRVAASMGASAFVVGAVLGVSSRASMPGQSLYPVSNLIDVAAVSLAGSDQSRGETLLSQAERHIGQAEELASMARRPGSSATADDVQAALQGALDTASMARQTLQQDFALRGDPSSLVALRNFTLRVTPALAGLVASVPVTARSLAGQLQSTVTQIGAGASTGLTACPACLPVVALTNQQLTSSNTPVPSDGRLSGGTTAGGTSAGVGKSTTSGAGDTSGGTVSVGTPVSGGPASGSTTGSVAIPASPSPAFSGSPAAPPAESAPPVSAPVSGSPAAPPSDSTPPIETAPPAVSPDPSAPSVTIPAPPVTIPAPPVVSPPAATVPPAPAPAEAPAAAAAAADGKDSSKHPSKHSSKDAGTVIPHNSPGANRNGSGAAGSSEAPGMPGTPATPVTTTALATVPAATAPAADPSAAATTAP